MKKMKKKDFILVMAIFSEDLHNALINEDEKEVEFIFQKGFQYEIRNEMVDPLPIFNKDEVAELKRIYEDEVRNDNLSLAL